MESTDSRTEKEGIIANEEKNFTNDRLENGLTLRKRKINAILSKKRGLDKFKIENEKGYSLNKEEIKIPIELKNKKYDTTDIFLKEMKIYLESENIEYNKYGLYCIRFQITNDETGENKNEFADKLVSQKFVFDILNLINKYIDNKEIIYEGLGILINILYYQIDNVNLVLLLSGQQYIPLYIKILDKKDDCLRAMVYWLLTNIIFNHNSALINEILFHLYMSPLFRLYLIKDLEENRNKMKESEVENLVLILISLTEFINDTFLRLEKNDIKNFIDYNSKVDYESIKENNNFLFYHLFDIFINFLNNADYTNYCLMGLSKLTNFLENPIIFQKLLQSGICQKLIKGEIKVDEEYLTYSIQIIGNFLKFSPDNFLDINFLEECLNYLAKLFQKNSSKLSLKRDIFWSVSNISINSSYCPLLVKSGFLVFALQSICVDNDLVINEALYMLAAFFNKENIELIANNYYLDYIKNIVLCLKNIQGRCKPGEVYENQGVVENVILCICHLFDDGNIFREKGFENKFMIDFAKNGGYEILELMLSENNLSQNLITIVEKLCESQKTL